MHPRCSNGSALAGHLQAPARPSLSSSCFFTILLTSMHRMSRPRASISASSPSLAWWSRGGSLRSCVGIRSPQTKCVPRLFRIAERLSLTCASRPVQRRCGVHFATFHRRLKLCVALALCRIAPSASVGPSEATVLGCSRLQPCTPCSRKPLHVVRHNVIKLCAEVEVKFQRRVCTSVRSKSTTTCRHGPRKRSTRHGRTN